MKHAIQAKLCLRAGILSLLAFFLLPAGGSAALVYDVSVDTSSIAGTDGFFDFQFNPGGSAPSAAAMLSQFDLGGATLVGSPTLDGEVSGTFPGTLTIGNSAQFNALLQGVTFGISLSFHIEFGGDFLTQPSTDETVFGLVFWPPDLLAPLLPVGPLIGASVEFRLLSGTVTGDIFAPGTITPVPEPATWALLAAGILCLAGAARQRART
jgi:hypothetical protein